MGSVQHAIHPIVSERIAVAGIVGSSTHDGDVAVKAGAAVVLGQALTELTANDSG